jgi:hypothetical protein
VPEPAIAADFDQPLDVEINIFPELSLDMVLFIDYITKPIDFILGKVLYPDIRGYIRLGQDFIAQRGTDAVNVLQRYPYLLIYWYVDSGNTWHLITPIFIRLALSLFMTRVAANNPDDTPPFHNLALFTSDFY